MKYLIFFLLCCVALAGGARAQDEFPHPELEWKTIETQHFFVHYHEGAERTGRTVAKIAEDVFEPVTSLYKHVPDQKVTFVIKDYDDISNGGAYFFDNKIEIYASSMDFELRGTHNWLRNVITHEFTHIIQIQTSMKFGRRMPAFYLQWLGYESERRPDVLYGYPNVVVSYPVSGFVVPAWFAEGVAQYNRPELQYDNWDSHRDMILRSYALDGNMLSWEQMGVFGKTSLGNESSYNAGFAFVSYIARTYGEDKIAEISRNLASLTEMTIDGAIETAVGKSGEQVYNEWRASVQAEYAARVAPVRGALRQGEPFVPETDEDVVNPVERERPPTMMAPPGMRRGSGTEPRPNGDFNATTGFANMYPAYSFDGNKVAYVSAKGADYFLLSSLYVYDFEKKKETLLQPGVRTSMSWSPDGKKIYYGRVSRDNPHWSLQFDIYRYDLEAEKEERVTRGRRALSPAVSPDGTRIAFVVDRDGTSNLAICGIDGTGYQVLTPYINGEQVYNPKWSPSGDKILFDYSVRDGRDIASIRPDGTDLVFIITGPDDSRWAVFTPDGSRIIFSSDRTGIFNLYSYVKSSGAVEQVTNVLGGAFFPTVNPAGDIIYSSYTSGGYKVVRMQNPGVMQAADHAYVRDDGPPGGRSSGSALAMASGGRTSVTQQFDWPSLRTYDDTKLPAFTEKPYRSRFTSLTMVPVLRVDNYNTKNSALDVIKPGIFLFSNDFLDKTGFFAGASINRKLERDLFLQFFYRSKIPLLYQLGLEPIASLELYNVTRKGTEGRVALGADTIGVDVSYNLLEFDLALNQQFFSQFSNVEFRYAHSRYSSSIGSFILPEAGILVAASSDLYLIANDLSLTFSLDAIVPSRTSDINPMGRKVKLRIGRELNKFNGDGEYEPSSTGLKPKYKTVNFTRAELNWQEHFPFLFKNHTLSARLRGGTVIGPAVDEFFDFYAGGLVGMKGYPFYAISGNTLAAAGLEYRFPLLSNIDLRLGQIYLDKLYASVYGDVGHAWTGALPKPREFKADLGAEIRLESFSFYSYPTRVFFNAAYGLNRFDRFVRTRDAVVTYGKEWRFYFGILFGFDFD